MTSRGKFLLTILILGIVGLGLFKWYQRLGQTDLASPSVPPPAATTNEIPGSVATESVPELVPTQFTVPALATPSLYQPKNNIIDVELSEYAGYAGLIAANGGLEPNDNSVFAKKFGFKVRLTVSEDEDWSELNMGKIAASATTADVLAIYGKQFHVVVPAQIGFSRGADGVVVRSDIKRINDLKGRTLVAAQFTEAEFFIRYLAQEAGLEIVMLPDLTVKPDPNKLNLVFCADAFAAGDMFLQDVRSGANRLAGCVSWAPKTTEIVASSNGAAHLLATNRNLLIIADVLVVHRDFAAQNPDKVAGLVYGLIEGNRMVRNNPEVHLDTIAKAFKWTREETRDELSKVHLANLPENLAFFSGSISAAGSFGGIYQSALFSYGSDLVKSPVDPDKFVDLTHLKSLDASGEFKGQQVAIAPIRTRAAADIEGSPILSKDIRFLFAANAAELDPNDAGNRKNLETIHQMLQVSPGSTILLRGHVDSAKVEEFRQTGGDKYVRTMALRAIELSRNRAAAIRQVLVDKFQADPQRIDIVGRGWEEPVSANPDQNRRVEVQWFMLE
jgi:NitT/TauT family transport system substrate-binding protein